jgi:hypothetical protein
VKIAIRKIENTRLTMCPILAEDCPIKVDS